MSKRSRVRKARFFEWLSDRYVPFTFQSLFPPGSKGALLSSASSAANFQTDAGETLAGFGDPVGLALDIKNGVPAPAGPGAHFSTSVTADRLTRVEADGIAAYEFDGVSDHLLGNATARDILKGAPGVTFICAFRPASLAAIQYLFSASVAPSSSTRCSIFVAATTGRLGLISRRLDTDTFQVSNASSGGSVVNQTKILTVTADFANGGTGAIVLRENGQVVGTADIAGTGSFDDTTSLRANLGSLADNTSFLNGQLFREVVILGRRASDAEISAAEARLAALTGVTL